LKKKLNIADKWLTKKSQSLETIDEEVSPTFKNEAVDITDLEKSKTKMTDDQLKKPSKSKRSHNYSHVLDKSPVFLDDIDQNGERLSPAITQRKASNQSPANFKKSKTTRFSKHKKSPSKHFVFDKSLPVDSNNTTKNRYNKTVVKSYADDNLKPPVTNNQD
jgi:hypothetical protein